jgi:hypothetical protein
MTKLSPHPAVLLGALALAASCAGAPTDEGAAPDGKMLCDGSGGVRLTYLVQGGHVDQDYEFHGAYGHAAFVIDGQCHYWAAASPLLGLRTGVLEAAAATEIARKLHWGSLATLSKQRDGESCPDAGDALIGDGASTINCTCGCDPKLPAATKEAFANVGAIHESLMAKGAAFDGPLRALTVLIDPASVPKATTSDSRVLAWSLPFSPAELLLQGEMTSRDSGKAIESSADRAELRKLRTQAIPLQTSPGFFVRASDGAVYRAYARDEAPAPVVSALAATR